MIISEFGAGLGDVVTLIHNSDRYNKLERMGDDERAMVVLMCHNPHVKELFLWHPRAAQFDICDVGFWWPSEDKKMRALHGLPPPQPLELTPQESVKFYPSQRDLSVLGTLRSSPYVVVSASAGGVDRNFPDHICDDVVEAISDEGRRGHGFWAVATGRRYNEDRRCERGFAPRQGFVNMIDRLSVPGTIELVARSSGVVCCHSAVCLIAWYLKKPVFLAYPRHVKEREFDRPSHQYTFGKDFPTTTHVEFGDYNRERLRAFLDVCARGAAAPVA